MMAALTPEELANFVSSMKRRAEGSPIRVMDDAEKAKGDEGGLAEYEKKNAEAKDLLDRAAKLLEDQPSDEGSAVPTTDPSTTTPTAPAPG